MFYISAGICFSPSGQKNRTLVFRRRAPKRPKGALDDDRLE